MLQVYLIDCPREIAVESRIGFVSFIVEKGALHSLYAYTLVRAASKTRYNRLCWKLLTRELSRAIVKQCNQSQKA